MAVAFTMFDYQFNNEQLEEEFEGFLHKYGLDPLFTNEHRAGQIRVTYAEARSVMNVREDVKRTGKGAFNKKGEQQYWKREEGRNAQILKEFANNNMMYLAHAQNNKSYEEAVFKIIYDSRSLQGLINKIRSLMKYMDGQINDEHRYNQWNIVWYNKQSYG